MSTLLVRSRNEHLSFLPETAALRVPHLTLLSGTARRCDVPLLCGGYARDEMLVVDWRASLRPAQLVERKLMCLLKNVYMPVSQVRATVLYKGRGPFRPFPSR